MRFVMVLAFLFVFLAGACPLPALAQEAPAQAAPPPRDGVQLHVEAPADTLLLGRRPGDEDWTILCTAPCDQPVALDLEYQVRGPDMKPSRPFRLKAIGPHTAVIKVDKASRTASTVGGILVAGSLVAAPVGLLVLAFEALGCGPFVGSPSGDSAACNQRVGTQAEVLGAMDVTAFVVGLVTVGVNYSTDVTQTDRREAPVVREPAWHTAERRREPTLPSPVGATLMTLRF
jgi:hypothetical protein